jgi:acetoacetyl-CoA synthetase
MSTYQESKIIWMPDKDFIEKSSMFKYITWLREFYGLDFDVSVDDPIKNIKNYEKVWKWSVENLEDFWESIWQYFGIISHSKYSKILTSKEMPGCRWFVGAKLNYAEHCFRYARWGENVITYIREDGTKRVISWNLLAKQVASLSNWLKEMGVKKGDVVAAYVSQIPEAVSALLATASIGAVWVAVGLELMPRAVIDRFNMLGPKVLFVSDGYQYNGKEIYKKEDIEQVLRSVPTIEKVVTIPNLKESLELKTDKRVYDWRDVANIKGSKLEFEQMEFNEPLWVLFTSGTTGIPKPVVHGHGGILIEAYKASLHLNSKQGDKFLWYSTPTWMMWNAVVDGLLFGTHIVFYDGSPIYRYLMPLWEVAEKEELTFLGTSAPFIHACMKIGLEPGKQFNLKKLEVIGSTAAPLSPQGFRYIYEKVKEDVWLHPASGGTDVCSGFVGGNPILPLWEGEMQCRWLGVKAEAYNLEGKPVINELGELVIELPMPSMPLYFWGDKEMKWYKESYFSLFPGVWWHGDWIIITDRGTAIITGRSDSTLKRKGVRIGTLDIYKVVESLPEIQNSLAVEVKGKIVLFVVLKAGYTLTDEIKQKINNALREQLGPYFIADIIIQVPDIPMTLNFKKLEVPIKKILLGWEINKAVNLANVLNPDAVYAIVDASKPYMEEILKESA